jgi:transposase
MYRDVVQWSKIRHRILVKGDSRRQVARETGISTNTIDKMLAHRHPLPYRPRSHCAYSKRRPRDEARRVCYCKARCSRC